MVYVSVIFFTVSMFSMNYGATIEQATYLLLIAILLRLYDP